MSIAKLTCIITLLCLAGWSATETRTLVAARTPGPLIGSEDSFSKKKPLMIQSHNSQLSSLAFSSGNNVLASGDENGNCSFTNVHTGELLAKERLAKSSIFLLSMPAANTFICLSEEDRTIRRVVLDRQRVSESLVGTMEGRPRGYVLSKSGKLLAASTSNGTIEVWDVIGNKAVMSKRHDVRLIGNLSFTPDELSLAWSGILNNGRSIVETCETKSGKQIKAADVKHNDYLAYSADGRNVASAATGRIEVLDSMSLGRVNTASLGMLNVQQLEYLPGGMGYWVLVGKDGAFEPGKLGTIEVRGLKDLKIVKKISALEGGIFCISISGDGKLVAIGGATGQIAVIKTDVLLD